MKKRHIVAGIIGIPLTILLIVPLIIPVPKLKDTVADIRALAYPYSTFTNIGGLDVHCRVEGRGTPAIILLHGFGASLYSWRDVAVPLSRIGTVIAIDYPPFGLTGRYSSDVAKGKNKYGIDTSAALTVSVMKAFGFKNAILVGNSLGGYLAAVTALSYPSNVSGLILVDAAVYSAGPPPLLPIIAQLPQVDSLGPLISRQLKDVGISILISAWHDTNRVTKDVIENYRRPLRMPAWDRALWSFTAAVRPKDIVPRLSSLRMPVLVITGDDDRLVPASNSIRLARDIPGAKLIVITNCGHMPQEEKPREFMNAVEPFLLRMR
ncbi:MAG: alpha/beta hydrolase [Spirochaetota bacterium]